MSPRKRTIRAACAMVLGIGIVAAGAAEASPAPPPSTPGTDHVVAPITYARVDQPMRPDKPGRGPSSGSVVYSPAVIQSAYGFGSFASGGNGQVIVIVDAYGDPTLASDLAAFDSKFNITGAGGVNTLYPDGTPTATNSGWATETALDVEWAHANAPAATIDVVVAPDASFQHLLDAVSYAVHGLSVTPTAISMSWGAPESDYRLSSCTDPATGTVESCQAAFEAQFAGSTADLFASSGDQGAYDGTHPKTLTVGYPASSPEVVGVGGTTLTVTSTNTWSSETAWSSSGGGYSQLFAEPGYQGSAGIPDSSGSRGVPDVSFDANPSTGVYVYQGGTWYSVGGTSVGSPNWAAIAADGAAAGSPVSLGALYGDYIASYGADFHDVTSGTNGYYSAGTGWDAVTGVGSPVVNALL